MTWTIDSSKIWDNQGSTINESHNSGIFKEWKGSSLFTANLNQFEPERILPKIKRANRNHNAFGSFSNVRYSFDL